MVARHQRKHGFFENPFADFDIYNAVILSPDRLYIVSAVWIQEQDFSSFHFKAVVFKNISAYTTVKIDQLKEIVVVKLFRVWLQVIRLMKANTHIFGIVVDDTDVRILLN